MIPAFETGHVSVYHGDALTVLRGLPADSVDCVVTSPPYWGLRDYGVEGQVGLERTPFAYVAVMVEIFREVRRVLAPQGTLWLNLGDSYAAQGGGGQGERGQRAGRRHTQETLRPLTRIADGVLKPKDMVGIPWRVAFALQEDGWYLRSDIIWAKPNPMPESVTDRPTKAHEYVFLMSKSERYFFDQEAVREVATRDRSGNSERFVATEGERSRLNTHLGSSIPWVNDGGGRNVRTVWTIATRPYPDAHFATFPRELPERCIKAGCPEGGSVLDPFAGSGTTLAVARDLGRKSIGIELNPEYVKLIEQRCAQGAFDMAVGL